MATRTSPDRKSSRQTLFPGEAKAFARSGIDPEEALEYLFNRLNAHQASLTAEDPTNPLEDRQGSAPAGSTPPHGSRARRDLALLRRSLKVTSGEIAVLAGKDPSAVTHWRKGQKKFPEPVVGGRSPLFNFDEVHDWLERHDKLANEPDAAWLWRKSVQALHQATGQEGRSRLRGYVTAMVVVLPDFLDDISGFVELRETAGLTHWFEETGWDLDKVNVNGGAIALGHPIGATGTRLMATLLNELERSGGRYGMQPMCEGGGQANVTIIERL